MKVTTICLGFSAFFLDRSKQIIIRIFLGPETSKRQIRQLSKQDFAAASSLSVFAYSWQGGTEIG